MTAVAQEAPALVPPVSAADLYDAALSAQTTSADATAGGLSVLSARSGSRMHALPLARWCAPAEPVDITVLDWLRAALPGDATVLDLGCGPGRHGVHLVARGLHVLGVDTSTTAVALARGRCVPALRADALGRLPERPPGAPPARPGSPCGWDGVLLLDGNIGLSGDPLMLLCRVRDLLVPTGRVLLELDPHGVTDRRPLRLCGDAQVSAPFAWARLGSVDLVRHARLAGLRVVEERTLSGRVFALLAPDLG